MTCTLSICGVACGRYICHPPYRGGWRDIPNTNACTGYFVYQKYTRIYLYTNCTRLHKIKNRKIMRTIFNTVVPFLPKKNCQDSEIRQARLSDLLLGHKFKSAVEAVRAETDPEKRKRLKETLPCFMPSIEFWSTKRSKNNKLRWALHSAVCCCALFLSSFV